jgi:hypothetical protein
MIGVFTALAIEHKRGVQVCHQHHIPQECRNKHAIRMRKRNGCDRDRGRRFVKAEVRRDGDIGLFRAMGYDNDSFILPLQNITCENWGRK